MSMMYTCDAGQEHRMLHGWGCVDAGARHLNQIRHHSVVHVEDYVQYEKEDRGHGAASEMVSCGEVKMEAAGEELDEALGPNVTVQLVRRGETCHSSYHLFSTGRGCVGVLGAADVHFGTTHNLGSISVKKSMRIPCVRNLVALIGSKLRGWIQYKNPEVSFRGMYWYPPGGFTEWHTDGHHVEGWRVYFTEVDIEKESYFAFINAIGKSTRVLDWHGQANMFRLIPGKPLWHAVVSESAHRFSMGVAVSDSMARSVMKRLSRLPGNRWWEVPSWLG
eukprot:CAMPEP_0172060590 /NCGR_PEP_ID=MMETSP1043-20130122/8035_1 /TAXON_ID=464988 /ORGANISM="Hemiselmis andersenii, Strain CCMP441" /LENGTH=276 /DNA_ID=CAMNT_0012720345 /DNA_START=592 /DNA_END=1422 /DNA_ORIENTATION=-